MAENGQAGVAIFTEEQSVQMARECGALVSRGAGTLLYEELTALCNLAAERAIEEYRKDTERMDFLEHIHQGRAGKYADMYFGNKFGVTLYARKGVGSQCEFSGGGHTVRDAIDAAIAAEKERTE